MFSITRETLTVLNIPFHWYGILIALGALAGSLIADRREARFGLPKDSVVSLILWVIPSALVGSRLYYVLFRPEAFLHNPLMIFNLRTGGMAIYGGLIGGVIAGFLFSRKHKLPFLTLADLAAPSIALGQAIGRWGNFLNREAYGMEITRPELCFFPLSVYIPAQDAYFAATFFYESAWCFVIVIACFVLERKKLFRFRGAEILFYTAMYGFERTLVEAIRTDSLYLGSLRVSQALSLLLLFAAAVTAVCRIKPKKKRLCLLSLAGAAFLPGALSVSGVIGALFLPPAAAALLLLCLIGLFSSAAQKAPAAAQVP